LPASRATDVAKQNAVPPPAVVPTIPQPVAPEPTPVVVAAPKDSQPVATSATEPTGTAPGTGPGSGGGSGGGVGGGVGPGVGPGSGPGNAGGGAGGVGRDPQWSYGTLSTEKPPKELKGRTIRVTFYVLADGRVSRVEVEPAIQDKDYARNIRERFESFRFKPARNAEGLPVPGVTTMTITLSSN
jgi:TonB family protein